jgi:hypothetical protein
VFSGFNAKIKDTDFVEPRFYDYGINLYKGQKKLIHSSLKEFVISDEMLSEEDIEGEWFPTLKYDVFLSHSHKDEDVAIEFAGFLYSIFGITTFIDSCVWNYSDELLRIIDNEYCVNKYRSDGKIDTYSYSKRNNSTAHVHTILNTALQKMIDRTECIIFLNTPNSVLLDDVINGVSTASPWIYSELLTTRLIRHRKLSEYREELWTESLIHFDEKDQNELVVKYNISTDHLTPFTGQDLLWWWKRMNLYNKHAAKALDDLYKYKGLFDR